MLYALGLMSVCEVIVDNLYILKDVLFYCMNSALL